MSLRKNIQKSITQSSNFLNFLPFYQQIFRYMLIMLVVDRDASPAIGSTDEGGLGLPGLVYLGADHHGDLGSVDIVDM